MLQRITHVAGTFKPSVERIRQRRGGSLGGGVRLGLRFPADIQRNTQIPVLRPYVGNGHDAGEAGLVLEVPVGIDDALEVFVGQETLGAFAGDFVHRVDKKDFATRGFGFLRAADDDAGFHGRVGEGMGVRVLAPLNPFSEARICCWKA